MHTSDERFAATPAPPRRLGGRPLPPGVEYHRVLAGEKPRVGRGILAIVLLVVGMFAFNTGLALIAANSLHLSPVAFSQVTRCLSRQGDLNP